MITFCVFIVGSHKAYHCFQNSLEMRVIEETKADSKFRPRYRGCPNQSLGPSLGSRRVRGVVI